MLLLIVDAYNDATKNEKYLNGIKGSIDKYIHYARGFFLRHSAREKLEIEQEFKEHVKFSIVEIMDKAVYYINKALHKGGATIEQDYKFLNYIKGLHHYEQTNRLEYLYSALDSIQFERDYYGVLRRKKYIYEDLLETIIKTNKAKHGENLSRYLDLFYNYKRLRALCPKCKEIKNKDNVRVFVNESLSLSYKCQDCNAEYDVIRHMQFEISYVSYLKDEMERLIEHHYINKTEDY